MSRAPGPPSWAEVTALFGGTFDPPHLGHREAIEGLRRVPGVGRVIVLPSGEPRHKVARTPAAHRLTMARLAFSDLAEVSDLEVERSARSGKPTYTWDTLSELRRELKDPAFVIGTDQLRDLPSWHRFPQLLALSHWIVLERKPGGFADAIAAIQPLEASGLLRREPGGPMGLPLWRIQAPGSEPSRPSWLVLAPTEARAVSSQAIREELVRSGKVPEGVIGPEIETYLKRHHLYGTS